MALRSGDPEVVRAFYGTDNQSTVNKQLKRKPHALASQRSLPMTSPPDAMSVVGHGGVTQAPACAQRSPVRAGSFFGGLLPKGALLC